MMNWNNSKLLHVAKVDNLRYDCHFIATNDDLIWKDTPEQKAVNAAFKNKEDMADTIPYEQATDVSWTSIQVLPGCYARIKGEDEYQVGDTPHEAASYLEFEETYNLQREPITTKQSIQEQTVDILKKLHGSVHYTTIPKFLNYQNLDKTNITHDDALQILTELENDSSAYRTTDSNEWWSTI